SVALPSFGYALERGPLTWAGLAPAPQYDACRLGKKQSPIVVYTRSAKRVEPKNFKMNITQYINSGGVKLENLGTTLEVHAGREHGSLIGVIAIEGEPYGPYRLENMHFHTPSEHRINDEYYPLEMHLVFKSGNRFAVIGVLFQLVSGSPPNNEFMHNLFLSVRNITRPGTSTITGTLDFRGLSNAIKTGPLYTYNGSLTTPPCTENVKWLVLGGTRPLHVDTYNKVKSVMKFNARYSQNAPGKINLLERA
ncbi:putative carbonic anhydrase, partial [Exidia glandulosa HHB12029]